MLLGALLGLVSSLCFAVSNMAAVAGLRGMRTSTGTLVSLVTGCLLMIPAALLTQREALLGVSLGTVLWFALVGIFNFPLGRYLSYLGMSRIGVSRGSAVRSSSPIVSLVAAFLLLGEVPSLVLIGGTLLISFGVYILVTEYRA